MIRALIASDLHIDIPFNDWIPSRPDCDVVIIAGDVQQPLTQALPWLRRAYPDHPIIYVPGNHDFYSADVKNRPELKTTYERQLALAPRIAEQLEIHLLDNSGVMIDGVRILGSTLWTDFSCRPAYLEFDDAVRAAAKGMNDYRAIKVGAGRGGDRLRPRDTIAAHKTAVRWLTEHLAIQHDGETVVVTHHAPSPRSLLARTPYFDLDWCYASNLEHLMRGDHAPALWVHGHVHRNQDYQIGNTRVLCNPRGYPKYALRNAPRENPSFDPELVVEIGRELTPTWRM